jgi:4-aminobutyrate aminotransferase-like enzyme/Ser/Thr protein kinase RdoA (MazF antagonist)
VVDFQTRALLHIAGVDASLPVSQVVPAADGAPSRWVVGPDGRRSIVRLLTFLPGQLLEHTFPTPELLRDIGATTARLARALRGFFHPAARHDLLWDLLQIPRLREHTRHIQEREKRRLVEHTLADFEDRVLPQLRGMRAQIIHNDVSCHNTLVDPVSGDRVTGVIDFGDMIHAPLVNDIAVPVAELMAGQPDRLGAAMEIVAGYHSVERFTEDEIRVAFDLATARAAMSLTVAAWREKDHPENIDYITGGNAGFSEALEWLAARDKGFAHACLRHACGLPAAPNALAVNCWLQAHGATAGPLLDLDLAAARKRVLPNGNAATASDGTLHPDGEVAIAAHGCETACGGRTAPPSSCCDEEACTVHLGIDLYAPAGTPVFSPLDATLHGIFDGEATGDSATVILEHAPEAGVRFYSVYRSLQPADLQPGQPLGRGERLGEVGDADPPHLHFQLATTLLAATAPPPTCCEPSKQAVWKSFCPDPNALLGIPREAFEPQHESVERLLERRALLLGPALEIFYDRPVHTVRASGVRLIDASGRAYIDAYNNVPQVGHCHPAVVEALTRQAATLNTNTRYLFASVLDYAERLTATLPEGLSVCMFLNSGSEANDLAWRVAKAHTGHDGAIVLRDAYHGITDAIFHLSPSEIREDADIAPHVATIPAPDDYRGPHRRGEPDLGARYAAYVDEAIEALRGRGHAPAAFYIDPGLMSSGVLDAPEGYLPAVFARVRAAGGLCVTDEVQSGFGRMGTHLWGFGALGGLPDVVTLGKPIGNGHPIAALVTRPEILRSLTQRSDVFSTFGGNPVACAVGLAVLDVLEREGLRENALRVGAHLKAGLQKLAARHPLIGDVRGSGLIIGVELVRDRESLEPAGREAHDVMNRMREEGVLVGLSGMHGNVLKIRPALAFSEMDAERLLDALDRALAALS